VNISQETLSTNHSKVIIELSKEDYLPQVNKSLKEYAKKVSIKGFRKGKVPANLVKNMYGSELMGEEISKVLMDALYKYLEDEKLDTLGSPLPIMDNRPEIDIKEPTDYTFAYEVGLKPDFELPLVKDEGVVFTKYLIKVEDETIDEEVERLRKRLGKSEEVEDAIVDGDIFRFKLTEKRAEDADGEAYSIENVLPFDLLTDAGKEKVSGKKVGDIVDFEPFKDVNKPEAEINKMLLMRTDDAEEIGHEFTLDITKVNRVAAAELNQEFFDKLFGKDEVDSEAAMRDKIKEEIAKSNDYYSNQVLHNEYVKQLMEKAEIDVPDAFLRKLFDANTKEPLTDEQHAEQFPKFIEGTKWNLLRSAVAEEKDLNVEQEEIHDFAHKDVEQQLRQYAPHMMGNHEQVHEIAHKMMGDQQYVEQAYMKLLDGKIFAALDETFILEEKEVSVDEFNEIVKQG